MWLDSDLSIECKTEAGASIHCLSSNEDEDALCNLGGMGIKINIRYVNVESFSKFWKVCR